MKLVTTLAAAALLSAAALPALAQQTTNGQGEAVGQPTITAAPPVATQGIGNIGKVTVLAVADASGISIQHGPNSTLTSDPKVTDALTAQGYNGSQILGYNLDGSDLTVYVKEG